MKASQMRQKNEAELSSMLKERYLRMAELNFDLSGGKVKNVKEMRSIKLDIARIMTLQCETKIAQN